MVTLSISFSIKIISDWQNFFISYFVFSVIGTFRKKLAGKMAADNSRMILVPDSTFAGCYEIFFSAHLTPSADCQICSRSSSRTPVDYPHGTSPTRVTIKSFETLNYF